MSEKQIVTTEYHQLDLPKGGFELCSGERLPEITVAFETYGELNAEGTNVICICPTLTSDAHVAGYHSEDDPEPGWWDALIGPGRPVDTDRYFVICSNILGGCKGTTGPGSVNPETGTSYGADFPIATIKDAVRVQKLLIDQLNVKRLHCVIGGSMGGMQALEWAICYPDFVERCICIASAVNLSPQALAFDIIGRQEIEQDPDWGEGAYYDAASSPDRGLSRARQIGHVTYLSSASMASKFGREERDTAGQGENRGSKFATDFQVESYLNHQGEKFTDRFDANSYLYITKMMDHFDLKAEHGGLGKAFADVKSRFLIISVSSDWLFPPEQQLEIVQALISLRKDVSYFSINSIAGHDAFLLEYDTVSPGIQAFVDGKIPDQAPEQVDRGDLEHLSEMVGSDQRILDIGSGDGATMLHLHKKHGATGLCLDFSFDMVAACMRRGLNAVQLDADKGLELFADNSFDVVILNQTIQQLHRALRTLKQIVRIAPQGIIGYPNFAFYRIRLRMLLKGELPVTQSLPYQWYDTPNIHVITVKDFQSLCDRNKLSVNAVYYRSDSLLGKFLVKLGIVNLGAERVLVRIAQDRSAAKT